MAFQMIHMEIAYRLLGRIPQIDNAAEFMLGSVAPDSVHMNPNFNISMKIKSHMFEGCGEWSNTQDYQRWNSNVKGIFCKIADERDRTDYRDFVFGLCVHCLTDYWNDIKIWKKLQSEYIPPMSLDEFRTWYYPEARGIDLWLYQNSENTKAIRKMLADANAYDVEGFIHKEELERQRNHLLNTQYHVAPIDISDYHFLSEEAIEEFVNFAVSDIAETITKWLSFT